MGRILHICWGLEPTNGAANIARMITSEQKGAELKSWLTVGEIRTADEVWCHCGWYYGIWWAVAWAKIFKKRICWVPECCYDPMRLAYHGWKKRLVGPIERWALRQCDEIVATCAAEAEWVRTYEPRVRKVVVTDIKRFFKFKEEVRSKSEEVRNGRPLKVLYLGRDHPLKGTEYLKKAIEKINARPSAFRPLSSTLYPLPSIDIDLKMASAARGEELDALWRWADVFVLPTLSDNFGLVIAEALEHGVPVITTDGAPAWEPEEKEEVRSKSDEVRMENRWRDRLVYLRGYRDGTDAERVRLLKDALERFGGRG